MSIEELLNLLHRTRKYLRSQNDDRAKELAEELMRAIEAATFRQQQQEQS